MKSLIKSFLIRKDGVAAVEFALVAPMIILLIMGAIEAGMLFQLKNSMTFHTRSIAREVALGHLTESQAKTELQTRLSDYASLSYSISVHEPPAGSLVDTDVVVKATLTKAELKSYTVTGFLVTSDMETEATMRTLEQ